MPRPIMTPKRKAFLVALRDTPSVIKYDCINGVDYSDQALDCAQLGWTNVYLMDEDGNLFKREDAAIKGELYYSGVSYILDEGISALQRLT